MLRRRRLSDGPVAGGYETKKSGNQPGDPLGETTPDAVPVKSRIRRYRDSMDLRIEPTRQVGANKKIFRVTVCSWAAAALAPWASWMEAQRRNLLCSGCHATRPTPTGVGCATAIKGKEKKKRLLTTLTTFGTWTVTILQVTCEMVGNNVGDGLVLGPGTAATLQCFEVAGDVGDAPTNKQRGI